MHGVASCTQGPDCKVQLHQAWVVGVVLGSASWPCSCCVSAWGSSFRTVLYCLQQLLQGYLRLLPCVACAFKRRSFMSVCWAPESAAQRLLSEAEEPAARLRVLVLLRCQCSPCNTLFPEGVCHAVHTYILCGS